MFKFSLLGLIKTVLPLGLGVYLIWYFFSSMSEESLQYFYKAVREANYFWIILALFLSFLAYASRAYRWKYVLEPMGYKTKFWNRYHAVMIGYIVNLTIPRAGEASRSAMLYRSDGVPFSKSFGTIIAERAVDLVMLVGIACLTAYVASDDFGIIYEQIKTNFAPKDPQPGGFPWKIVIYGVFATLFVTFIGFMVFSIKWRSKLFGFAKDVFAGLISIFRSKNPLGYIGHTFFIWICYVAYFMLPFLSMEETKDFPLEGLLLGFIAGSLGITFTNGGIGTFPLLVALVVVFFLVGKDPNATQDMKNHAYAVGNAIGMIIWVSQTLMLIFLGLLSLVLLPKNYSKENVEAEILEGQNS
jgi:uncharacterized membrane protein YbhN (UPF0104 family)